MRSWCVAVALTLSLFAPDVAALQPARPDGEPPAPAPTPEEAAPTRPPPRVNKGRRRRPRSANEAPSNPAEDLDRTVVRWYALGARGIAKPKFITARELAFEARLEALTNQSTQSAPYTAKDVRAAIQRRISEEMLASLPVSDNPTPKQVASYAEAAREILAQRIAADMPDATNEARRAVGLAKLDAARRAEGIAREELDALLRRRARASWYLDKMVAPMLKPSELDLREAHRRGETPFTPQSFDEARDAIERWYTSARLATALDRYFRNVRSRVEVVVIGRPPVAEPAAVAPRSAQTKPRASTPTRAAKANSRSANRADRAHAKPKRPTPEKRRYRSASRPRRDAT